MTKCEHHGMAYGCTIECPVLLDGGCEFQDGVNKELYAEAMEDSGGKVSVGSQIDFRMPWPPSLNRYYRTWRGRILISKAGRLYREEVIKLVRDADLDFGISCDIKVSIGLAPPKNNGWDIDNYTKGLFDALTHAGVWKDDKLIVKMAIEKLPKYAMGEVYISIEEAKFCDETMRWE